jgi:lipid-A-disaccharide synthase
VSASRTVFISAGEQSGDLHGGRLARELTRQDPSIRLFGIGGSDMAAAGVTLVADIDRLAVLGAVEVLRRLPHILRVRRRVRRYLLREAVDLVILIDYPGFNLDLARFAHRRGMAVVYYVAPQVWVWHESRSKRLRDDTDLVCSVLPFEADFLAERGVNVEFVGHPLLDELPVPAGRVMESTGRTGASGQGSGRHRAECPTDQVLGVFPASRRQELDQLLPTFVSALRQLSEAYPDLEILVARPPDIDTEEYGDVRPARIEPVETVLRRATVALTKSGTINLQLALRRIPMVVGYRASPITVGIARRVARVDRVSLVNLIAGRMVVPEHLQEDFTAPKLLEAVAPLLDPSSPVRRRMVEDLDAVSARLGDPGCSERVAARCLELLEHRA